jgi:hypothetical protein
MRKVFSVALLAAMVCLVGVAKDASATVTFSLIWTSTSGTGIVGTNSIFADPGDVLILSIRMSTDQTMAAHGISLNFDTDLGNELNLFNPAGGAEWSGTSYGSTAMAGTYAPLVLGLGPPPAVDSTGATSGRINTFESGKTPSGAFLPTGTYTVGTAKFIATANLSTGPDGADVFAGLFNVGVDEVLNNLNAPIGTISVNYGDAAIQQVIPEPGTASLLGLGLLGLVLAGRRNRR